LPLGRAVQHTGEIDAASPIELLWVFGKPAAALAHPQVRIEPAEGGHFAIRVAPGVTPELWGDAEGIDIGAL